MKTAGLVIRALDAGTWPAYATLVDANKGVWGGCWCLVFHADTKGGSYEERKALKERMVREGRSHAALVFDGDDCIGWAQYGRAAELPEIRCRRKYEAGQDAPPPDWRITCFFIAKAYRRSGVASVALDGALDLVAAAGGGRVEAYPEALEGQKTSAGFLWGGTLGVFERAGFTAERKIALHRWVVAREVAPA